MLKNGAILNYNNPNVYRQSEGTIKIIALGALDEGYYQCQASNQYGSALSNTTLLQRAVLSPYTTGAMIKEAEQVDEGKPYTITCNPTKCFPKPTYTWAIAVDVVDQTPKPLILDKRIQIDDEGLFLQRVLDNWSDALRFDFLKFDKFNTESRLKSDRFLHEIGNDVVLYM